MQHRKLYFQTLKAVSGSNKAWLIGVANAGLSACAAGGKKLRPSHPHLKSILRMVLLPLPLAPTTAQLVPAGTLNDTPFRMLESGRYLQAVASQLILSHTNKVFQFVQSWFTAQQSMVLPREHPM